MLRRQSMRHFSDFLHFSTYLTSWFHFELWREQEAEGMNQMMIDKSWRTVQSKTKLGIHEKYLNQRVFLNKIQNYLKGITREASYVYILSGQKFIKSAKKMQFWICSQKVLPERSFSIRPKKDEKSQNWKIPNGHLESFSNTVMTK